MVFSLDYKEQIQNTLTQCLENADIKVEDRMGDGQHLMVHVVSDSFKNKNLLEQHRMVYKYLQEHLGSDVIGNKLHALQILTQTKE